MYKQQSEQPPKKIVLLSDGTGNSSAKLMKTNVWRMYQAIDLSQGDQVAMYDNGVGTSSFKPLLWLGGGIGVGLKRNVRQLYKFACQSYEPGDGDERLPAALYLFGFSRGAFTVRILAGLISTQGLIQGVHGQELDRQAKWAFRRYQALHPDRTRFAKWLQGARDGLVRTWERFWNQDPYDGTTNVMHPNIAFIGLWDTVDAYGLPVDEMTTGWDKYVWPLTLRDRERLKDVDKICHAVALDDERISFHPVLYTERDEALRGSEGSSERVDAQSDGRDNVPCNDVAPLLASNTSQEHLTQVWFTGMHSDIGGGYPDDGLAYVPLCWMGDEVVRAGLRLADRMTEEWRARADPLGPMHDSRRGLAAYYRYKPRRVEALCKDNFSEVCIRRPKIHESVFQRIRAGRDDYAPIVLPAHYAVVENGGAIVEGVANYLERPDQAAYLAAEQERVWDRVWLRRWAHFASVATSLVLIGMPFIAGTFLPKFLSLEARGISRTIDLVSAFLPGFTKPWTNFYRGYPLMLGFFLAVLAGLWGYSTWLESGLRERMRTAFADAPTRQSVDTNAAPLAPGRIHRLRSTPGIQSAFEYWSQRIVPWVFGRGAQLTLIALAVVLLYRVALGVGNSAGWICKDENPALSDTAGPWKDSFSNQSLCHATGVQLQAGTTYRVTIELPEGGWKDGKTLVTSPAGFSTLEKRNFAFFVGLPFRRLFTVRWFVPTARIGAKGLAEYHPLDADTVEFTPRRDGQLFLFVNDVMAYWPWRMPYYANNDGQEATVTITKLP